MKLKVFSQNGEQKESIEISDKVFGGEINQSLLYTVIKSYLANKRQGTAKTKGRSEVSGGGTKPFKQKGTGRARAGSNTSIIWVRGGKAFGPDPRSYGGTIPRTMRKVALRHALSSRVQEDRIIVVESVNCETKKTKVLISMLNALALDAAKNLLLTDGVQREIYLSGRNIKNLRIMPLQELNAYEVLRCENIVLAGKDLAGKLEEAVTR